MFRASAGGVVDLNRKFGGADARWASGDSKGQIVFEVDGVLRFGLPGQPLFPALGGDSILKPTLSWLLETDKPGSFNAELSYVSGGMNWHSDYNLVVADGTAAESLEDWRRLQGITPLTPLLAALR